VCGVRLRACVDARARRGLVRLTVRGAQTITEPLLEALAALPNASHARRGVFGHEETTQVIGQNGASSPGGT